MNYLIMALIAAVLLAVVVIVIRSAKQSTHGADSSATNHGGERSAKRPLDRGIQEYDVAQLRFAVKCATSWCESYRDGMPFSNLELAIGFACWAHWVTEGCSPARDPLHLAEANKSARRTAIELINHAARHPDVSSQLRQVCPTFDPFNEHKMAQAEISKQDPRWPQWKMSLTRSAILCCRALAYALCEESGYMPPSPAGESGSGFFEVVAPKNVGEIADLAEFWLEQETSPMVAKAFGVNASLGADIDLSQVFPRGMRGRGLAAGLVGGLLPER